MKRLDFPAATDTLDLYNLAYIGALNPGVKLTPAEYRTHAKLLDKLDAIGVEKKDLGRVLLPGERATLILEDAEHELLARMCEEFPWNPGASRRVVQLFDLLKSAPDYTVPAPDPVT